ncbi:MAG: right-handed parallel beta-helix repeat-containing protein, partial [Verrucomicrobiae bacterium]|nr:right-handed parallel beta-helix repeat-containing protein [Verrucomicrobiae bacterium]
RYLRKPCGGNGGALNILDTETEVLMYNCTVAQNQGAGDGWGIFVEDASLKIRNSIVAGNNGQINGGEIDNYGTVVSNGHNFIGLTNGASNGVFSSDKTFASTGTAFADVLEPLADNGGPTPTHALVPGSPAIDAGFDTGSLPTYDQRGTGFPRVLGASVDIGAVESPVPTLDTYVADPAQFDPMNPARGDSVTWKPGAPDAVGGLTFGTDAFSSVQQAVDAVASGGSVHIDSGSFGEGPLLIDKGLTLQGDGVANTSLDGDYANRVVEVLIPGSDEKVTFRDLTIKNGRETSGAGVRIETGGDVCFERVVLRDNIASISGGAILMDSSNEVVLRDSLVTANSAETFGGGGIQLGVGTLRIVNSTLSGNTAVGDGGAIENADGGVFLVNSTVTANTASEDGGIGKGATTITNSIVAGNIATENVDSPDGQINRSFGWNFVGVLTRSQPNVHTFESTGLAIEQLLAPLADNGGPTMTHALLPGTVLVDGGVDSVALDTAGTFLEFDQRGAGFPRVLGAAVDIGAYERLSTHVTNTDDSGEGSLRQAVLNANTLPGADVITFSDGSGGTTDFHTLPQTIALLSTLNLSSEIDITAPASGALTIDVSAAGFNPMTISGTPVILRNLTLRGGNGSVEILSGRLDAFRCTFTGFSGSNYGAVHCIDKAIFDNCTFSGNPGGAVHVGHYVQASLTNCTVTGNGGQAIYLDYGGRLAMTNSIIAGNGNGGASPDIHVRNLAQPPGFGTNPVIGTDNFIGVDDNGWFPGVPTFASTGTTLADLLDVTLQNNGGPTQTHALVSGSPAIDAGTDTGSLPATDQRGAGYPRIVGSAVDIGAFELLHLGGPSLTVPASVTVAKEVATAIPGITVSDPDPDALTMTFTATNGTLAIGGQSGTSITLTDTPSNLNTLLAGANGLKFTGLLNVVGTSIANIEISVSDLIFDPISKMIPVTITGTSYDHWRFDSFPFADVTDAAKEAMVWGDLSRPSGGVLPNVFKFVHGLDPAVQDIDPPVEQGTFTDGGDTFVTYTFRQRKDIGGVELSCGVSGELLGQAPLPGSQRVAVDIPGEPEFEQVTWLDNVPITETAPRYGRLIASASEAASSETFVTTCFDLLGPTGTDREHYNFVAMTGLRPLRFAGTVDAISDTTLTCNVGDWPAGAFTETPHYVILVSGSAEGTTADIVSHDGDTLTLSDPIGVVADIGDAFEIRAHATFDSVFGAENEAGLHPGPNASDADNVLVPEPSGAIRRTFYSELTELPGWLSQTYDTVGDTAIHPEQGFIVARKLAGSHSLYFQGAARLTDLCAPIEEGFNLIGIAAANTDLRLGLLEHIGSLYTGDPASGMASGVNATDADTLWIVDPVSGSIVRYFHNGTGWFDAQYHSAGNVSLPPGAAFYINRKARNGVSPEDNAFAWKIPALVDTGG